MFFSNVLVHLQMKVKKSDSSSKDNGNSKRQPASSKEELPLEVISEPGQPDSKQPSGADGRSSEDIKQGGSSSGSSAGGWFPCCNRRSNYETLS